jgi:GNAT superfamily N-acetyltransferase
VSPVGAPVHGDPLLGQRLAWLEALPRPPRGYLGLRLPHAAALLQGALLHAHWQGEAGAAVLAATAASWPVQRVLCHAALDPGELWLAPAAPGASSRLQRLLERLPQPVKSPQAAGRPLPEDPGAQAAELGALLVEAFPEAEVSGERAEAWVRLLAPSGGVRLLRQPDGSPAACLLETFAVPGWRLLEALAVRRDRRGCGLARRLLEAACDAADEAEQGLRLLVDAERTRLGSFYEGLGFRETGRYRLLELARSAP